MTTHPSTRKLLAAIALLASGSAHGQVLFSESFDSGASANLIQLAQGETTVDFVDYSNFTLGAVTHSIPEAPNQIDGSPATRGVVITANQTSGVQSLVNLVAADAPDGNGVEFSGNYRLRFDMFLSLDPNGGVSGSTEQGIWGVGTAATIPLGRTNRNDPQAFGTWGWLATENGYSTEDAIFVVDTFPEVAKVSNGSNLGLFESAFPGGTPIPAAANNTWVEVDVTVLGGTVTVSFNGVEFFSHDSASTDGFATIGYEDTFTSLSSSPDYQFGLFDNFVVEVATQPTLEITEVQRFNPVTAEGAATQAIFSAQNNRDIPTNITAVNITGDIAPQVTVDSALPVFIPAGSSQDITLTFTAGGARGIQSGEVEFASDDDAAPSIQLPIEAVFAPVLLARYKLDETEDGPVLDCSGNGVDGAFDERDPLVFGAEPLAGAGTSIGFTEANAPDSGSFAFMRPLHVPTTSISLWVKPDIAGSGEDTLFNRDPFFTGADDIYGAFIDDLGTLYFRSGGELVLQSEPGAVPDGETSHIVITHLDEDGFGNASATRSRMYVNGQLVAENQATTGFDDYPANAATRNLFLATRSAAGSGYTGLIDDVQIYSVELEPFQVASMFSVPGSVAPEGAPADFAITDISYDPDAATVTLRWNSFPGHFYIVSQSADLLTWQELEDGYPSDGLTTEYVVEGIGAPPGRRFFRVLREQP